MRILIADDQPAFIAGVRLVVEEAGMEVCAEVNDASAAVKAAVRERPDICLLDIHMPGNGIKAAAEIASRLPQTAVVMLTVSRNESDLSAALQAGASGYLLKDLHPSELSDALRHVAAGEAVLSPSLTSRVLEVFRERGQRPWWQILRDSGVRLTSREWEVLEFLKEGLTTRQIAEQLVLSQTTVRTHISAILRKLHVRDREAAVRLTRNR
jgi:DNA-binding NarL/FixJ family response regulator